MAEENFEKNKLSQIPLSSVVVRWQFTRTRPVYNEDSLRSILSEYGNVREVRMISLQSALVIFEDLTSACDVMQCHNVGERRNRLACSWWHRSMSNKSIIIKPDGMHIMTNTFQI
ncbi:hypothetical protein ACJMK2_040708 [Sinanodonta woodiana]|uniref:RRM domain-containing protein n=1 Tax=Sinanodonta woodiana TaxID=1069815 RepID=A0ABD3W525_SINWO